MTKRHRSAVTGEYVTAEQAKADPERTVSERVTAIEARMPEGATHICLGGMGISGGAAPAPLNAHLLLARIEALEAAVAELQAAKGNNDNN